MLNFFKEKWQLILIVVIVLMILLAIVAVVVKPQQIKKPTTPTSPPAPLTQESTPPPVSPTTFGQPAISKVGVTFKTYKGLDFPWGINNKGVSTFRDWLSSKYDAQTTSKAFDQINSMGVQTVGIWLWFDRMLVKDSSWGTGSYRTQFNSTYKANWENFLRMVKSKNMEVIVTMFPGRNGADHDPYNLEGDIFTGPERGPKWRNYTQAVKDWVSMYGSNTEFGSAIASWQGIKEASDGGNYPVVHDFLVDFYQTIKSTSTTQPVGIDNSPYFKLPVTDPKNQRLFTDAADYYNLHLYRDDGVIPDTSKLDKPFIIGELGATQNKEVRHLYSLDYNLPAVQNFYQNGLKAGAKTVMAWDWNDNGTVAQHKEGNFTLGPVGQWIKNWHP